MLPSSDVNTVNTPDVQTLSNVICDECAFTALSCGCGAVLIMAMKSMRNPVGWLNDDRLVKWTVGC